MKDIKYTVTADDGPFGAAMDRVRDTLKQTDSHVNGLFAGLQAPFGKLLGIFGAMTAVLAGGKLFSASVDTSKEFTGEANKLAKALGINATEASTLNVALGDIYSSADTFTDASNKLAKQLRTNEDGLKAMGLQTREANGQLRPMKDLMMDSLSIINGYSAGVDRTIATQEIFGKGAEEVTGLLKLSNEVLAEAKKKQEELGLIVGKENVQALKAYKAAMNDAGDVVTAVKKAIGDALMPVLTQLATWWSSIGPAAVTVVKGAIGGLVAVFWGLYNGVNIVWQTLDAMVFSVAEPLLSLGKSLMQLTQGDFKGAAQTMASWPDRIAQRWSEAKDSILDSSKKAGDAIYNLFAAPTQADGPDAGGSKRPPPPKPPTSLLSAYEAELNLQKQQHANKNAAEGTYYEFSKQRELEFWQAKAAITLKGSRDAFGIQAKVTAATLDIQKEAFEQRLAELRREQEAAEQNFTAKETLAKRELALVQQRYGAESKQAEDAARKIQEIQRQAREQRRQLRDLELTELQQAGEAAIELAQQHAQQQLDARQIDKAQMLQLERQFEAARFELAAQAARDRLALVDPTLNPVEYARLKGQIEQIEQQHRVRMGQINTQTTQEQLRDWTSFFGALESGFGSVINGMLTGSRTLLQTVRGLFSALGQAVAATLAQIAARWLVQQIAQRVMGKVTAASQVAANAAIAGSAAFASTAAIPVFGPALAPEAAAAAYAGALSFLGTIPAALKGYDVPAGVNPLTQLHQKEMVLPEGPADVLRQMAANGGPGQAPVNFHIHALDGASVKRVLIDNPDAIGAAVRNARRNFNL